MSEFSNTRRKGSAVSPVIIPADIVTARAEAGEIVEQARETAAALVAEAEAEAAALCAEAREAGYREGLAQVTERALLVREGEEREANTNREHCVRLAIRIAEKILAHTIEVEPETLNRAVSSAIKTIHTDGRIRVRVNTSTLAAARAATAALERDDAFKRDFVVIEDQTIVGGGCIVESKLGSVDARFEAQLQVIEDLLVGKHLKRRAAGDGC